MEGLIGYIIRKTLSFAISALLLTAGKEATEREIASLPSMEDRVAGKDLQGWSLKKVVSPVSGAVHYYYAYPSVNPTLPVLLCLHGFNTDSRVFFGLKSLSTRFRLIAYNFPEESPVYTGKMSDFNGILDDFLATENIDTLYLLGNSIGGGIAQHYAASKHTATLKALILVSTSVFGATEEDRRKYRGMADRLLPYPDYKLFYLISKGQSLVNRFEDTPLGDGATADLIVTKHIAWYRQVLLSLYTYDGRKDAPKISVPVLALHGADDRVIPNAAAQTIPIFISQSTFINIPKKAHSLVQSDGLLVSKHVNLFLDSLKKVP
jgi:pimeloyl-ACP methyl ester carboxylesterase